jgi:hypothetical protein
LQGVDDELKVANVEDGEEEANDAIVPDAVLQAEVAGFAGAALVGRALCEVRGEGGGDGDGDGGGGGDEGKAGK